MPTRRQNRDYVPVGRCICRVQHERTAVSELGRAPTLTDSLRGASATGKGSFTKGNDVLPLVTGTVEKKELAKSTGGRNTPQAVNHSASAKAGQMNNNMVSTFPSAC